VPGIAAASLLPARSGVTGCGQGHTIIGTRHFDDRILGVIPNFQTVSNPATPYVPLRGAISGRCS